MAWEDSKHPGDAKRATRAKNKEQFCFGCACLQKRGDWSWMKQALAMIGWRETAGDGRCCWKCRADRNGFPFTDASLNARWRQTFMTTLSHLNEQLAAGDYIPLIFEWPGFILEYLHADFMHCVCLGIVQCVLGNILWELFHQLKGIQKRPDDTIAHILVCLRLAAKKLKMPTPLTNLTLNMFKRDQKAPKLIVKAAEGRSLVPVILKALELFFPPGGEHDQTRYNCLARLDAVYHQLKNWSDDSPHIVSTNMRMHVLLYSELSTEWLKKHKQRTWIGWKFYPKHHLSIHCCEDQVVEHGNPAASWCYRDENEIGCAVVVAESGIHPTTLSRTLMERHRLTDVEL